MHNEEGQGVAGSYPIPSLERRGTGKLSRVQLGTGFSGVKHVRSPKQRPSVAIGGWPATAHSARLLLSKQVPCLRSAHAHSPGGQSFRGIVFRRIGSSLGLCRISREANAALLSPLARWPGLYPPAGQRARTMTPHTRSRCIFWLGDIRTQTQCADDPVPTVPESQGCSFWPQPGLPECLPIHVPPAPPPSIQRHASSSTAAPQSGAPALHVLSLRSVRTHLLNVAFPDPPPTDVLGRLQPPPPPLFWSGPVALLLKQWPRTTASAKPSNQKVSQIVSSCLTTNDRGLALGSQFPGFSCASWPALWARHSGLMRWRDPSPGDTPEAAL